ncbi:hypothetical protein [Nocardioides sp.]|uniref:hypothetical protein n=1 Tax=Nocardioides sp. TaxID=35761 RepID=UPI0026112C2C|nr:hypothetical protein [Nocardioides sp.]MCW2736106.1 hypothetical protein [Nocardioides sp.]
MTQTKNFSDVVVKNAAKGEVSAVFSTFNHLDLDGDVTLPGAIKDGAEVVISAYGHQSHYGALPVGRGKIRTTPTVAILEGQFFMSTESGRDTFEIVKELGELGEWSYSLHDVVSERGTWQGEPANLLKSIRVKEVSPVLLGAAGPGATRTLVAKAASHVDPDLHSIATALRIRTGMQALQSKYLKETP